MTKEQYEKIQKDKKIAAENTSQIVLPYCQNHKLIKLFDYKPIEIEGKPNDPLALFLDRQAGLDYLFQTPAGVIGLATRTQFIRKKNNGKPYNSFTIRAERQSGAKTELEKRIRDVLNGDCIYPQFTLQAYMTEPYKDVLSVGVIKTKDLYQFALEQIQQGKLQIQTNEQEKDRVVDFAVIWWDQLNPQKIRIK